MNSTAGKLIFSMQYAKRQNICPVVGYFNVEFHKHEFQAGIIPVILYFHPQYQHNVA